MQKAVWLCRAIECLIQYELRSLLGTGSSLIYTYLFVTRIFRIFHQDRQKKKCKLTRKLKAWVVL